MADPPGTPSILKTTSAYDHLADTDAQFFPTEERPEIAPLPIPSIDPLDQDDYDDPEGSMFSGPAARSFPTSVSAFRMRHRSKAELDRLSSEWTRSRDDIEGEESAADDAKSVGGASRRSRRSSKGKKKIRSRSRRGSNFTETEAETEFETGDESEAASHKSRSTRRRRKSSAADSVHARRRSTRVASDSESDPEAENRPGFFRGLSNALRGRPSISRNDSNASEVSRLGSKARRSRDLDEDAVSLASASDIPEEDGEGDPYGPYGSSDTNSSSTSRSSSSQEDGVRRRRGGGLLPGMTGDTLFGESRIDFEDFSEDEDEFSSEDETDGNKNRNAQQLVYIPDEDLPLKLNGLTVSKLKLTGWTAACIASCGSLWLLGRWLPNLWNRSVGRPGEFEQASYIVVETFHHAPQTLPLEKLSLPKPIPLNSIFPPSLVTPPAHREDYVQASKQVVEEAVDIDSPLAGIPAQNLPNVVQGKKKAKSGEFRMVREWKDPNWTTMANLRRGLTATEASVRTSLFGPNAIEIASRGLLNLLVDEVLHPFYIFQIFSIALWAVDDYYYYAFAIAIISVVSIVSTLIETKGNIERMREMSRFSCTVRVQRGGEWQTEDSGVLVPGDLVDISDNSLQTFPADLVLLSGDAIVNESMLTGESVPVSKYPIENEQICWLSAPGGDISPDLSRHVVFSGTKIIRVRQTMPVGINNPQPEAVAMVLRTGFNTTKGALVRSMLFPKPFGFAFYRDSFRFIGVLGIVAVLGFLASSVNFVKLGIAWSVIVIRALDLITIVVPPALPATMSIGTSFAISRLRSIGIFCISPSRVNIGGKVNIVCFDKTGTLTEEGLDVLGVRSVKRSSNTFAELEPDADNVPIFGAADAKTPLLHALTTCHALKIVDGHVIGDPLDMRMFEFTNWTLEEGRTGTAAAPKKSAAAAHTHSKTSDRAQTLVQTVVRPPGGESFKLEDALKAGSKHAHFLELGVLRTFDFVSSLRRMSVLVKKLKSNSVEAYVKGAPEVMRDICEPSTLPADYDETLAYYTKHGYRVIALAGKSIPGLSWIKAQRMKRENVESELRFLGIIVFENKLKPGTTPAIATLRAAHIPTRMVTGDNVRTAISVGKECGMISSTARVFLPKFTKGNSTLARSSIEWNDVDDELRTLDPYSLKPLETDARSQFSGYSDEAREYHLAISGDVFRWMMDFGALETLQRMLVKGIIFARMSPDEKHELVERLQSLGYTVGFCGDGANDCGALKAADVGLSLSEAEASVAAPFTSRQPDIRCFIEVIKEGRAALVTSFSCFKFMALYSLIQFTTVCLLYAIASTLGDFQFLYIDLFLILPIAVTMGRTEAFTRIHPKRPTANLISKKVLTSLIGQISITSGFQFFTFFFVRAQSWYIPPEIDPDELDIVSFENTALFLISSFQYILVAAIFCVGPPYRKPIWSNRWLVAALAGLTAFSLYTLFVVDGSVFRLLQLISLPHEFHLELLLLVLANCTVSYAFEEYGAYKLARFIGDTLKRWRRFRGHRRTNDGKVYKMVARAMED